MQKYRICRKVKDGFETEEFGNMQDALLEKQRKGGFIDAYDQKLGCWKKNKAINNQPRRKV